MGIDLFFQIGVFLIMVGLPILVLWIRDSIQMVRKSNADRGYRRRARRTDRAYRQ